MIVVSVTLSSESVIAELAAEGHAQFALKGSDIVCSAFTILLRTFARSVEATDGVSWSLKENVPGRFHLEVSSVELGASEQYRGWCSFLLRGFEDLAGDEPQRIRIEYGRDSGRLFHGS